VFQNDYLMRMILELVTVIQRALRERYNDPEASIQSIEIAVGNAVDIESGLFFSLAPESMVSMLRLGDFDERLGGYVVRSMLLEAELLERCGQLERAALRKSQAEAIARAYDYEVTEADMTPESLGEYFQEDEQ
jgi:hypothetical protein